MVKYYYIDDITKQQCGPFLLKELLVKKLSKETMVWRAGMADWTTAGSVPELSFLFNGTIPMPNENKHQTTTISIPKAEVQAQAPQPQTSQQYNQQTYAQTNQNGRRWDEFFPMPKNWLIESILFSIFCCSPISLVGIYYAAKVESLYYAKEYERASQYSIWARNWALAGMLFIPACYILLVMIGGFFSIFI